VGFLSVLVAPSPNVQDHDVGLPEDVSVKLTASPGVGALGENVKAATGGAAVTVTGRLVLFDPDTLLTLSVTVNFPATEYVWVGSFSVLVQPSPKFQAQAVGLPVDVSVNVTVCPARGAEGVNVKLARGAAAVSGSMHNSARTAVATRNEALRSVITHPLECRSRWMRVPDFRRKEKVQQSMFQ
jgi:hypothetical protein